VDVSFDVDVSFIVEVMLSVFVMLLVLVALSVALPDTLSPVMICGSVSVVSLPVDVSLPVVMFPVVMFPVMLVSLLAVVVVSFSTSLVVVISPVSKIRLAIEPLAENVSPPVAFVVAVVVSLVLVALPVRFPVVVALPVVLDVRFCATAGARLNAAAKSPKTSTSATAIGAFFIAKSVHESILTILSII
jgi:hypothetical protein